MKILIVHPKYLLESGGSEKVCTFLANTFVDALHDVEILTYEDTQNNPPYPPKKEVKVINLFGKAELNQKELIVYKNYKGKNPILWLLSKGRKKISKLKNKIFLAKAGGKEVLYRYNLEQKSKMWNDYILSTNPDLIITLYLGAVLEISYIKEYNIPIINSINGRPDYDYTEILWKRSKLELELLKDSYKNIDGAQLLLDSYQNFLPENYKGLAKVIENPVNRVDSNEVVYHNKKKERYSIIHIGSLSIEHKQQEKAIKAFSQISSQFLDWDLFFWGRGKDFELLNKLIKKLGLETRVFLKGFTDNPLNELRQSDLFLFPSKYEGFPLALTEAMAVGLPCLGFSECSGVNELIEHGQNGFLAQNDLELKEYLVKLIKDASLREKMGHNGRVKMEQFAPGKIAEKWNAFINEVCIRHSEKGI